MQTHLKAFILQDLLDGDLLSRVAQFGLVDQAEVTVADHLRRKEGEREGGGENSVRNVNIYRNISMFILFICSCCSNVHPHHHARLTSSRRGNKEERIHFLSFHLVRLRVLCAS